MTTRPVAGVRKFVDRHFPERQFYHRSRGSVQFVTLTARSQISLLLLSFAFFGWIAYASVNAIFKDQIIAAREKHFAAIQTAYEGRLAEMQQAYDDLNGALVMTQERFTSATSELENKHRQLSEILVRQEAAMQDISKLRTQIAAAYRKLDSEPNGNQIVMKSGETEALLAQSRNGQSAMGGPLSALFSGESSPRWARDSTHGMPRLLGEDTRKIQLRMTNLDTAQRQMAVQVEQAAHATIARLEDIVGRTGLNVNKVLDRVSQENVGGPFAPLGSGTKRANGGGALSQEVVELGATVERLSGLQRAFNSIPLLPPLSIVERIASNFGRRVDPFTSRMAFHYGLDMVAPLRTPVHATAPGVVTIAGRERAYGNLVEIDHGNGMRTRYGHLNEVLVKVGTPIVAQQTIGLLGSTGRSTGPHLHYEVRFNGSLRDPQNFLEAGRHVLEE